MSGSEPTTCWSHEERVAAAAATARARTGYATALRVRWGVIFMFPTLSWRRGDGKLFLQENADAAAEGMPE